MIAEPSCRPRKTCRNSPSLRCGEVHCAIPTPGSRGPVRRPKLRSRTSSGVKSRKRPLKSGARIGVAAWLPSIRFGRTPDSAIRFPTSPAAPLTG